MKRKKKGIIIIIIGLAMLPVSLVGWSVARFAMTSVAPTDSYIREMQVQDIGTDGSIALGAQTSVQRTASMVNIILSLLPLCGLFVLTPIGLIMILREEKVPTQSPQKN